MDDLKPTQPKNENDAESILQQVRSRTPARILTGRVGGSYTTRSWLELRADHAAARDAVRDEIDLEADFGRGFVDQWGLFEVSTLATSKDEYLLRPDLGRSLSDAARAEVAGRCPSGVDFQIVLGDGLSARAVVAQTPALLPRLADLATRAGWRVGRPFLVRRCRVGVLNDVGDLLDPAVVVLLIGERPGLATAESLSAYLAYRPRKGDDDSRRNLISNIHARGVPCEQAARRIVHLAGRMIELGISGVSVKETWTPSLADESGPLRSLPEAP
jgi:ethanolamine ammonia-lyase small subunit